MLSYLAKDQNWDIHDDGIEASVKLISPGGMQQFGIFLLSRNITPWIFADEALRQIKELMGEK